MSPAQLRAIATTFERQGELVTDLAARIADAAKNHGQSVAPLRLIVVEALGLAFNAIAAAANAAAEAPEEPSRRHH